MLVFNIFEDITASSVVPVNTISIFTCDEEIITPNLWEEIT